MSAVHVIFNPNAGTAGTADALEAVLSPLGTVTLHVTTIPAQARDLAAASIAAGADLVIAAGGDGTINEVVNGLAPHWEQAVLGILPRGTGNDLARSIAMPTELQAAVAALATARTERLDVVRVQSTVADCFFINVSAGGFSGTVDEKLTDEMKAAWGPFAYLRAAVIALPELANYRTTLQFDDDEPQLLHVYNIVVANGRFVAGGWQVAPHALLADGLMDVIVVPALPATKIALLASQLLRSQHLESDDLIVRRVRRFRVDSEPGMWFNVDGELVGNEPATFEVLPQRLRVIVGPNYGQDA